MIGDGGDRPENCRKKVVVCRRCLSGIRTGIEKLLSPKVSNVSPIDKAKYFFWLAKIFLVRYFGELRPRKTRILFWGARSSNLESREDMGK